MELTFAMGIVGLIVLAIGALVIGVTYAFIVPDSSWVGATVIALAAALGGFVASEFIVGWRGWEPIVDGLAIVPALVGGLVVAILGALAARLTFGEGLGRPVHS